MKNKTYLIVGSVCLLLGIFLLGVKFYKQNEAKKVEALAEQNKSLFVKDYSPRKGTPGAPVLVVEFLDPECESCRAFHPYTKMLLDEFPGQVELVIRYAPFHPNSITAVKILEASKKQNRYWETLEVLFNYQPQWGDHHNPRPDLIWTYLPEAGVNVEQIKADMMDPAIDEIIHQEIADVKTLGVRMTPTFYINGKILGRFSYDALLEEVRAALSQK